MSPLPVGHGIISVVQTPFDERGAVDEASLVRLVEETLACGVNGFLVPVVASEVAELTADERRRIVRLVAATVRGAVRLIVGASSDDPKQCVEQALVASEVDAAAYLVAVPAELYGQPHRIVPFFREVIGGAGDLPLVIQDLEFNGPGMDPRTIAELKETLPTLAGIKVETAPAGPKYTAVREAFGDDFFIAGGWAVLQMIEALDRGVDAMVPESSMVRVYAAIDRAYRRSERARAVELFRSLLPILAFTNQEIKLSIAFFKRLLVRKGIFRAAVLRVRGFQWDRYNERIADELIEHYLALESRVSRESAEPRATRRHRR